MKVVTRRGASGSGSDHFVWQDYVYTLLDGLGPAAFEPLRTLCELATTRVEGKTRTARAIAMIVGPHVAAWFAAKLGDRHLGKIAESYLERHPEIGIPALAAALPRAGRRRELVSSVLSSLATRHPEIPSGVRSRRPKAELARPGEVGLPPELLPPGAERILLPDYWKPSRLKRPISRATGQALPDEALQAIGKTLVPATLAAPPPGLNTLREIATEDSLAEFAWSLLSAWERSEPPAKDEGPLLAVVLFAREGAEERLIDLNEQWQMRRRRRWATLGFEALARIGTRPGLVYLEKMSRENKDDTLRERARAALDVVAAARAEGVHELLDDLVPTHGLGPDRMRTLEYSGRRVRVGFTSDFRPLILDEGGQAWQRLPQPSGGSTGDFERARKEWEALRKGVERTVREQSRRLEQAMCAAAVWRRSRLESLFARPLLGDLARRIVWSVGGGDTPLRFRVAEDGSFAGERDERVDLPDDAQVTIPHPLLMGAGERDAWQRVFSDYRIIQPFEQLSRPLFTPTEKEAKSTRLGTVKGSATSEGRMYAMRHRGWKPTPLFEMMKLVELADGSQATVLLELPDDETLGSATLHKGKSDEGARIPFGRLDPVTFSEIVLDLMAAKAT